MFSSIFPINHSNDLNTVNEYHPSTNEVTERVNQMAPLAVEVITQNLNTLSEKGRSFSFSIPRRHNHYHLFTSPTIDLSGISVDLYGIFIGGIGYGGSASRLMADAMDALGHGETVYNLPFCIEGLLNVRLEYARIEMVSTADKIVKVSTIK